MKGKFGDHEKIEGVRVNIYNQLKKFLKKIKNKLVI